MTKELEALEKGILEFEKDLEDDCNNEWLKRVVAGMKKCYQRLESIDQTEPSEALKCLKILGEYELKQEYLVKYSMVYDTIKQALIKAQEQNKKYNEINKTFSDSHICEIKKELSKYEPLCKESKCDECPLGIGDGICLKNTFEKKWELQIKAQEQEKVLKVIFEKNINMFGFKRDIKQLDKRFTYKYYQSNLGNYHSGFDIQELTEEEFELLKQYFKKYIQN